MGYIDVLRSKGYVVEVEKLPKYTAVIYAKDLESAASVSPDKVKEQTSGGIVTIRILKNDVLLFSIDYTLKNTENLATLDLDALLATSLDPVTIRKGYIDSIEGAITTATTAATTINAAMRS